MQRGIPGAHWLARSTLPGLGLAAAVMAAAVLNLLLPEVRLWQDPAPASTHIAELSGRAVHLGAGPAGASAGRPARRPRRRAGRPGPAVALARPRAVAFVAASGAARPERARRRRPAPDAWRPLARSPERAPEVVAQPSPDPAPAAPVPAPAAPAVEASVPAPAPPAATPEPAPTIAVPVEGATPTPAPAVPRDPCLRPRPWHQVPATRPERPRGAGILASTSI